MSARGKPLLVGLFAPLMAVSTVAPVNGEPEPPATKSSKMAFERLIMREDGGVSHVRMLIPLEKSRGWVALVPSLGRGVEDFTGDFGASLADDLVNHGYRVALIQPRGIGKSSGDLSPDKVTMETLANDLEQVFDALSIEQVRLVGHAFGNRLSRYFAATRTDRVSALVLLAAGGDFELSLEQRACLLGSFDLASSEDERLEAIGCAFFAQDQDPRVWLDGWYPRLAVAQIAAAQSVTSDAFKTAGGLPFLLVQPAEDFIAPPALAGRPLADELGDQVTYLEIAGAGHALLPERPDQVSQHILEYFAQGASQ